MKVLGEIHTRNNTAPANCAMTESVKKMVVFSEEHRQNLKKLFHISYHISKKDHP